MKFLGKLSFYFSVVVLLLGLILLFLLPVLKVNLVSQNSGVVLVLAGEAVAFLLGLIAIKTRHGKMAMLISLLIIAAILLYFIFAGDNPITIIKETAEKAVKRLT